MVFYKKIFIYFLVLLNIFVLAVIVSTIDRGFDFTDEGGFLLSFKNIDIYRGGVYNYHIIIDKLTNWLNPGIIAYRLFSLVLILLSSYILAFGLHKWLVSNYFSANSKLCFIISLTFISLGNFIFYFPGIQTIHNNTLTHFSLQVCSGIILYIYSWKSANNFKSSKFITIIVSLAILCSFSFFIKFSTGILQILSYVFILLLFVRKENIKNRVFVLFCFFFGLFIGVIMYFFFFQNYHDWLQNFKYEYYMLSDHSPGLILNKYFDNISHLIQFIFKYFSWLLLPLFLLILYFINPTIFNFKRKKYLINILLFFSFLILISEVYYFKFYQSTFANYPWINSYFYIIIILFLFALSAIFYFENSLNLLKVSKLKLDFVIIFLLLFITPFLGAFGTANPIFLNALCHSTTWHCLILILLYVMMFNYNASILFYALTTIISIVNASQVIDGNIFNPYYALFNQNKTNYFDQTERINLSSPLDGICVDKKTIDFLVQLKNIFNDKNYNEGYPIFGFHIPGLVYFLKGTSPGAPYYFNTQRDIKAFNLFEIKNNPPIILLTEDQPINGELLNTMRMKGIEYPDNYTKQGEVYYPNADTKLLIYFPQKKVLTRIYINGN